MPSEACPLCRVLLDEASSEILLHIRAVDRLDCAILHNDTELIPALEVTVREARQARQKAVSKYRRHTELHRATRSGASA